MQRGRSFTQPLRKVSSFVSPLNPEVTVFGKYPFTIGISAPAAARKDEYHSESIGFGPLRGRVEHPRRAGLCAAAVLAVFVGGYAATQDAIANGDTRTLSFLHNNTKETLTVTFRRNGQYDPQALEQLNWFLRDWRREEKTRMDPRLFDTVWEVYREVGSERARAGEFRLSLAQHQRDAAPPVERRRQEQPAHAAARRWTSIFPTFRPSAFAQSACGCRTAASVIIPTPTRRSCIWMSAACGPGRG